MGSPDIEVHPILRSFMDPGTKVRQIKNLNESSIMARFLIWLGIMAKKKALIQEELSNTFSICTESQ